MCAFYCWSGMHRRTDSDSSGDLDPVTIAAKSVSTTVIVTIKCFHHDAISCHTLLSCSCHRNCNTISPYKNNIIFLLLD